MKSGNWSKRSYNVLQTCRNHFVTDIIWHHNGSEWVKMSKRMHRQCDTCNYTKQPYSSVVQHQTHDWKATALIPNGSGRRLFFLSFSFFFFLAPGLTFRADSCLGIRSTPVLLQQQVAQFFKPKWNRNQFPTSQGRLGSQSFPANVFPGGINQHYVQRQHQCWGHCHLPDTKHPAGNGCSVRIIIITIIINPLTARVVGAPQMTLQPVFSIFPCSPLPSGTCRTPGLSIPWCRLPISSSACLVFFT